MNQHLVFDEQGAEKQAKTDQELAGPAAVKKISRTHDHLLISMISCWQG